MDSKDFIKAGVLLLLYCVVAPLLGLFMSRRRRFQRWTFGLMCLMTIGGFLGPAEWGLTLAFDPFYRGHARGFHFFFNEALALALIFSCICSPTTRTKLFPPGLWLYLLFCTMSMVSIINAPSKLYFFMAAVKAWKIPLYFVAAYNFIRDEDDLHFFLKMMTWAVLWECVVALKMKYVDQLYQVWGTFEHQNSLCMYTTMIGMVLLAVGAGRQHKDSNFYLLGFLACAVIVQCTLSRAGLVIFAGGTVGVMLLGLMEKATKRRVVVIASLAAVAAIGLGFTFDTIWKRFNEVYNVNSNVDRELLNTASGKMLHDHPLGIGWNNYGLMINYPYHYGEVLDDYYWKTWHEKLDKDARKGISESHYWLMLAENGYEGFITYILFISVFLWWSVRCAWTFRHEFTGCFSLGIAMGFAVNYLQSVYERVLTQPRNIMLWFILLAATAKLEVWRKKRAREIKKSEPKPTPVARIPERVAARLSA